MATSSRSPKKKPLLKTGPKHKEETLDFAALRAAELEEWLPFLHGNRFASVVVVKGEPGVAERSGQPPFFGEDGEALESALAALGWGSNNWCGIALKLPGKGVLSAPDLRLLIEILDPRALVALDSIAASMIQYCFGKELMPSFPEPGQKIWLLGRALVFVDGFESALASDDDEGAKRRVWRELKALKL